jgi:GTP-binding protein
MKKLPLVAVVGRPNVGKSTLVNRILGKREAIVHPQPGITRDRKYFESEWRGRAFLLSDTGGWEVKAEDISEKVRTQTIKAIEEAHLILFMVDAKSGLMPQDEEIALTLRKSQKPYILIVNKVDDLQEKSELIDFYSLGLGEPVYISALHGLGIGELLDEIVGKLPLKEGEVEEEKEIVSVAIVGRPNVGKSSLLNSLVGEERSIVTELPGTTRDSVDTFIEAQGHLFKLVDTAGIKRKSKTRSEIDLFGITRSLKAISRADISLLILDAREGITREDQRILEVIKKKGCGMIIALNKIDLLSSQEIFQAKEEISRKLKFFPDVPLLEISALQGINLERIFPLILNVYKNFTKRISTSLLNEYLQEALLSSPPIFSGKRQLKVYYATQVDIAPPRFVFFVNFPDLVNNNFLKFMENRLRKKFGFTGVPLKLNFKSRRKKG